MSAPAPLAVAHGTGDPAGPGTVRALLDRARRRQRPVSYGFVGTGPPSFRPPSSSSGTAAPAGSRWEAAYLLAPGPSHDRMRAAGADRVAPPIGRTTRWPG
jgi:sirohydrochlorin ferrochelatase